MVAERIVQQCESCDQRIDVPPCNTCRAFTAINAEQNHRDTLINNDLDFDSLLARLCMQARVQLNDMQWLALFAPVAVGTKRCTIPAPIERKEAKMRRSNVICNPLMDIKASSTRRMGIRLSAK